MGEMPALSVRETACKLNLVQISAAAGCRFPVTPKLLVWRQYFRYEINEPIAVLVAAAEDAGSFLAGAATCLVCCRSLSVVTPR